MIGNISRQVQGRRFTARAAASWTATERSGDHIPRGRTRFTKLRNKTLVNVDADVWGIEAGGDLQHDLNNKLGLFVSYRKGNYDLQR